MKRALVVCAVLALLTPAAGAAIPETMSYQSVLLDAGGVPVLDDDYSLTFKIYTTPAGPGPLWTETQVVPVEDGIFYVILGDAVALDLLFDVPYWLGIQVGGDAELTPRLELTSTPYAHRAKYADTGAPDDDWVIAGDDIYHIDGSVGIGASPPFRTTAEAAELEGEQGDIPVHAGDRGANKLYVEGENQKVLYSRLTETDDLADGRAAVYGVRNDGNPLNPGSSYSVFGTNNAVTGHNVYSAPGPVDMYSFGVAGYVEELMSVRGSRTGGVLGMDMTVGTWGALGYRHNFLEFWGVYTPFDAYIGGTLRLPTGAADGLVLTSDDDGNGSWTDAPGGIGGGGTTNVIPKFTGPTTLGNSRMYDGEFGIEVNAPLIVYTSITNAGSFTTSSPDVQGSALYGYTTTNDPVHVVGVRGVSAPQYGYGVGGHFEGGYEGVHGSVAGASPEPIRGVHGYAQSSNSLATSCTGVRGRAHSTNSAVVSYGVLGLADGDGDNYGVYGQAANGPTNYAGYFDGDTHVNGTLTKSAGSFKIDHPLDPANMYLSHSFVESPDMMNVYNGNVVLDGNGEAVVVLPEWFEVLNRDFRYQLTALGAPGPNVYVAEKVSGNQFRIAGGDPGMEISWQVTGIRQDKYAEEHRIQVEELKSQEDAGMYLHPDLYGAPKTEAIGYVEAEPPMESDDRAASSVRKPRLEERERTDSE